jgi:hypothetical protein
VKRLQDATLIGLNQREYFKTKEAEEARDSKDCEFLANVREID